MKFSKKAFGLALGILWGVSIFLATICVMIIGGGNTLALLQKFYFGYDISFIGAILGLIYGFVHGFIWGWLFALLCNAFAGCCKKEEKTV
jgi:tetrahydromethanopterin S-methyltransferase subunit G